MASPNRYFTENCRWVPPGFPSETSCLDGKMVIYPHCLSIVASWETKLWDESATALTREGGPILEEIYAWHYIVLFSHYNTVQKYNNTERSKTMGNLTKPCINLLEYWTGMEVTKICSKAW